MSRPREGAQQTLLPPPNEEEGGSEFVGSSGGPRREHEPPPPAGPKVAQAGLLPTGVGVETLDVHRSPGGVLRHPSFTTTALDEAER